MFCLITCFFGSNLVSDGVFDNESSQGDDAEIFDGMDM